MGTIALQKNFESPDGFTGNYWKLGLIPIIFGSEIVSVQVELYKDAAAYAAGKGAMLVQQHDLTGFSEAALGAENVTPSTLAYTNLVAQVDYFSDATPVTD